jgi:hypothetical protein
MFDEEGDRIMSRIKFSALATVTMFLLGVFASVSAQKSAIPIVPAVPPLNGTYSINLSANELSPGDTKFATQETYGWTCYGKTNGDLSGFMFISMNYTVPELVGKDSSSPSGNPPQPIFPTSKVTGGSWSKLIFTKGQYVGSVYGRIVSGELVWSTTDLNAKVHLELVADDGTGSFVRNIGKGTFEGTLDRMNKQPKVSGALTLEF